MGFIAPAAKCRITRYYDSVLRTAVSIAEIFGIGPPTVKSFLGKKQSQVSIKLDLNHLDESSLIIGETP
jgi:hypothetical protein